MLQLNDVFYHYGSLRALRGVSLSIPAGEIHGLFGMNGAGKTTLLKLIAGLLKLQQGSIYLDARPVKQKEVAFLPAHNYLYEYITGAEYLALFRAQNPKADFEILNRIFKLPLHRLVDQYSTGMRKKLAFMGIMALNRRVFVLDEPFNGVDTEGVLAFRQAVELLAGQGKIVLITSHIFESLTEMCHRIYLLRDGKIDGAYSKDSFAALQELLRQDFARNHRADWEQFFG